MIVSELIDYPRTRVLNVFLAGGDMAELRAMLPSVLEYGKAHACHYATLLGRRGWGRTFLTQTDGWTEKAVLLSKDLTR